MAFVEGLAVEPLAGRHDRASFSCGVSALDQYLHKQAGQDVRRRIAACFVLVAKREPNKILGFYSLAATSIELEGLPPETAKKLPRYPNLPATLLGRLAVASDLHGNGFGQLLLFDAFARSLASEIATFAIVVDPIDASARQFYERYRFLPLSTEGRRMFLPMSEIARLFA